jgi:hypothetical protein
LNLAVRELLREQSVNGSGNVRSSENSIQVDIPLAMPDPRDIIDIASTNIAPATSNSDEKSASREPRKFLSVWFRCCHTYGRMNRNKDHTAYEGRCPKCGARVHAGIGPNGTSQRMFEAG